MSIAYDVDERNRMIGENLRKYRLLKGMTQDELADGLCSVSQLSKVENGKTYIKREILKQMATRLGVTVERIETTDALLEELTEVYEMAGTAYVANNSKKAMELVHQVVERSLEFGYAELHANAITLQCRLLQQEHQYEEAIRLASKALEDGVPQNALQKMTLFLELGQSYQGSGNLLAAYDCYNRADDEFEFFEDKEQVRLRVNYNLARCHYYMKNYRTALRHAEKAESYAMELSKHVWRIKSACYQGMALACLGDYEKAEQILLRILKEANENNYLTDVAIISSNLGELFTLRGDYGQAQIYVQKAMQILELLNMEGYKYQTILQLGEIHFLKGELQQSSEYIEQVLASLDKGIGTSRERAKALRVLGGIHFSRKNFEKYQSLLEEALFIYEKSYELDEAYNVASELGNALYERGDARAVEFYRKAIQNNKAFQDMRR